MHSMRSTMVTNLQKSGAAPNQIQVFSGHRSIAGLAPYANINHEDKYDMASLLHNQTSSSSTTTALMIGSKRKVLKGVNKRLGTTKRVKELKENIADDDEEGAVLSQTSTISTTTTTVTSTTRNVFTMKKGKISSEFLMKLVNKGYKIDLGDVEVTD